MTIGTRTFAVTGDFETGGVIVEYMYERNEDTFRVLQKAVGETCLSGGERGGFLALIGDSPREIEELSTQLRNGLISLGHEPIPKEVRKITKDQIETKMPKIEKELIQKGFGPENVYGSSAERGVTLWVLPSDEVAVLEEYETVLQKLKYLQLRYGVVVLYQLDTEERLEGYADWCAVFEKRELIQFDSFMRVYSNPTILSAALAVGTANVLEGSIRCQKQYSWILVNGDMQILAPFTVHQDGEVMLVVRPDQIRFTKEGLSCKVVAITPKKQGYEYQVELEDGTNLIVQENTKRSPYHMRQECLSHILPDTQKIMYFDSVTKRRIHRH